MDEQKKEDDSGSVGERLEALEIELKRITVGLLGAFQINLLQQTNKEIQKSKKID